MTSNADGKTSASGTSGLLIVAISALSFLVAIVAKFTAGVPVENILIQCIALCYAGALLLGYRKGRAEGVIEEEIEIIDPDAPELPDEK